MNKGSWESMSDLEWAKVFSKLQADADEAAKHLKFKVNKPQLDKLTKVFNFFANMATEHSGEIEPLSLKASEIHGGVTATFPAFDIAGDDIKRFCDALECTSALSIDAMLSGDVCISVTVPDVFVVEE